MKQFKAFTLIEVLVVVVIMILLTAVILPTYTGTVNKTRSKDGQRSLAILKTSQEQFRATRFTYTTDLNQLSLPGFTISSDTSAKFGEYFEIELVSDGSTFSAIATGSLPGGIQDDIWVVDHVTDKPEHSQIGY